MPHSTFPIHFFGGSNELLVKAEAQKLAEELVKPENREFGLEIVNGFAHNTDEAITIIQRLREAIDTIPFFGIAKVVWWKNTNLFGDNQTAKSEAVADALALLTETLKRGLPSGVTLLISATEVDKRRSLYKTIEKTAECQLFDLPELDKGGCEQVAEFIATTVRQEGKTITPKAIEAMIELVGTDFRAVTNEIEKLVLYLGDRKEITENDVGTIVSATAELDVSKLLSAIGERNAPDAMKILDLLMSQGENVIGILALTAWNMRQILLCRDLLERKVITASPNIWDFKRQWERLPAEQIAHFPKTKEGKPPSAFSVHRAALTAKHFTQQELIGAMNILLDANRAIVSSGLDDRMVLEEAILKIIAGGKRLRSSTPLETAVAAQK